METKSNFIADERQERLSRSNAEYLRSTAKLLAITVSNVTHKQQQNITSE